MSDSSQGPGWWQASDGRWYPPDQAPSSGAQPAPAGGTGGTPSIDLGAALSYGWKGFTQNVGKFLIVLLAMIVANAVIIGIGVTIAIGSDSTFTQQLLFVLFFFAGYVVMFTLARPLFATVIDMTEGRGVPGSLSLDFSNLGPWLTTIIAWQAIIWVVGLPPLIGWFLAIAAQIFLFLTPFAQIEGNRSAGEAISTSFNTVKDNFGQAFILGLVTVLIAFAGLCLCLIGGFVTIPVAIIAQGYGWKILNGQTPAPLPES